MIIKYSRMFEDHDDIIDPHGDKSKKQLEEEYHKELGRRGELSKHLREHGDVFTFGILKAIYDDALQFKRKREFKKAGMKFFHRAIPMAASIIFLPLHILSTALGASRALDKMLYPILNDPGNNYSDFTKKIITRSVQFVEGDYRMFLKDDWFYNIFRVDQGLIDLIKKEHLIIFASYLSKKMSEEDQDKEVPPKYVQSELKQWIQDNFNIKVDFIK
jgi:hypothetical protein